MGFKPFWGSIDYKSTVDLFKYVSSKSGDFWLTQILLWDPDLQKTASKDENAKKLPKLDWDQVWAISAFDTHLGLTKDDKEI